MNCQNRTAVFHFLLLKLRIKYLNSKQNIVCMQLINPENQGMPNPEYCQSALFQSLWPSHQLEPTFADTTVQMLFFVNILTSLKECIKWIVKWRPAVTKPLAFALSQFGQYEIDMLKFYNRIKAFVLLFIHNRLFVSLRFSPFQPKCIWKKCPSPEHRNCLSSTERPSRHHWICMYEFSLCI